LKAKPFIKNYSEIKEILEEFKRFKNITIHGNDDNCSQQLIQQKLFQLKDKELLNDSKSIINSNNNSSEDSLDIDRKRLLTTIKTTECHVSLIDIGIDLNKRKLFDVKENKKKRKKLMIESSDEEEEENEEINDLSLDFE
jgi:hypothetical protein